ncbi:hypothetical protein [Flavobacterium sp. LM4]|uniref:hypothetical protein n=1 Tax=Flavobacterium sp. LM4 TaxID=1938609 RepID=UPI0009940DCA|nr:hypothetical protein [Flavobacterium sp. LM4]OOV20393.1 hypothetical protein BXU10_12575 [Flavobacterium sp. LM4]
MDRKKFLRNGLFGLGAIIALPTAISSCSKDNDNESSDDTGNNSGGDCSVSPTETKGPFPILTPAQYVRASIIGDRTGVALLMTLTIEDKSNGCTPLTNVFVDVWQCDKDGLYSQYSTQTSASYLRGRQTMDVLT